MTSLIASLHPAVVHFPIACFVLSALFDLLAVVFKHHFDRVGFWLLAAGVLFAALAVITGDKAESLAGATPALAEIIESHENAALFTLWFGVGVLILRIIVTVARLWERRSIRQAYILLSLFLAGAVSVTGFRGGKLVYEHGVGVKMTSNGLRNPADNK